MWVSPGGAFAASDLIFKATNQIRGGSEFGDRAGAKVNAHPFVARSASMRAIVEEFRAPLPKFPGHDKSPDVRCCVTARVNGGTNFPRRAPPAPLEATIIGSAYKLELLPDIAVCHRARRVREQLLDSPGASF